MRGYPEKEVSIIRILHVAYDSYDLRTTRNYIRYFFFFYRFRDPEWRPSRYRRFQHVHGTLVLLRKYSDTRILYRFTPVNQKWKLSVSKLQNFFVTDAEKPIIMVLANAVPPMLSTSLSSAMSYLNNNNFDTRLFEVDHSNCRYGQNLVGYSTDWRTR